MVVCVSSSCTGAHCPSAAAAEVAAGPQTGGLGGGLGKPSRCDGKEDGFNARFVEEN